MTPAESALAIMPHPWPGLDAGSLTVRSWGGGYMHNVILISCSNN